MAKTQTEKIVARIMVEVRSVEDDGTWPVECELTALVDALLAARHALEVPGNGLGDNTPLMKMIDAALKGAQE